MQPNCLRDAANRSCVLLTLNLIKMDIQTEVQKIHHQFGVTEKANYEIQKLFDKLILEDRAEQLRIANVVRSAYLVQHRETWVNHGLFDSEEKAKSYIKGSIHDFAVQKVDIA